MNRLDVRKMTDKERFVLAGYIVSIGADEYLDLFYSAKKKNNGDTGSTNMVSSKEKAKELAKKYALEQCIRTGTYSAKCASKGGPFIGTLADYLGMKAGDNIFFFSDRRIYGIGKLVNIGNKDCRFRIHPKQGMGITEDLLEEKYPDNHQFVCTFVPDPYFFLQGVDTDEVLTSCPDKITSLRFFSGMTFMKLDDIECEAIKNVIARKNEDFLSDDDNYSHFIFDKSIHDQITKSVINMEAYDLSVFDYIKYTSHGFVSSEYYIEGATMELLRNYTSEILGKWDFIGRQYPASPPKPSQYKEAMDLFGYRYVPKFQGAVSKYLVIEVKVGTINKENVEQTMKYVDWISREYAHGDYSMVQAYTIGFDKEQGIESEIQDIIERNYITDGRPVKNKKWQDLRILSYCTILKELREKNS